jgi:hypothetical protein
MKSNLVKSAWLALVLGVGAYAIETVPGTDPGLGIPACTDTRGWYSLFDGTQATLDKYWFLPPNQRHGNGGKWSIQTNLLYSDQASDKTGGALFTKHKFKNVEFKIEVKPHFGNDAGIFMRSTTFDKCYQVVVDYLQGDTKAIGGVYGESGLHAINYKPFGFVSPTQVTQHAEWFAKDVKAADWSTKIWKAADFNWVKARIYHDDPPWIDSWINGYQMVHYVDNKVEADNLTGYIGLQIHTGAGNWQIGNPEIYRSMLVREIKADTSAMDSYPEWDAKCGTSVARDKSRAMLENRIDWKFANGGNLQVSGFVTKPFQATVTDLAGKTVYRTSGNSGNYNLDIALPESGIHFLEFNAPGFHQALKVVRP